MSENIATNDSKLECLLSVADTIKDPSEREAYLRSLLGEFARQIAITPRHNELTEQNRSLRAEKAALTAEIIKLKQAVMVDELTGLPNRSNFISKILPRLERFYSPDKKRAYPKDYIIVFFDLDGLSKINNTQGHSAGDAAIINTAKIINSSIREDDMVFRIDEDEDMDSNSIDTSDDKTQWIGRSNTASDEFTAVIAIDNEDAQRVMMSVLQRIKQNKSRIDDTLSISAGFAVASDFENLEDALNHADQEMYNNKRNHYFAKGIAYNPIIE